MWCFKRSGLEGACVVADVTDDLVHTILHRLDLFFKPRRIQQREVDILSERVHIKLKSADALHVKRQDK